MKHQFLGFLLAICMSYVFTACSEDFDTKHNLGTITMLDSKIIKYYKDSTIHINTDSLLGLKNTYNIPYDSIIGVKDVHASNYWVKVSFEKDLPAKGLKAGTNYWAKILDCSTYIPCRSDEHIITFSPSKFHTGLHPNFFKYPFCYLGSSESNEVNTGGKFRYHTYVLRIDYADGHKLEKKYFPCPPDSLIWHFIRRKNGN